MKIHKLLFPDLPKISLNMFYAGTHWTKRKSIKDNYILLVRSVTRETFSKPCRVEFVLEFKSNPLDCDNCIGMTKLLTDILFPDDSIKVIKSIKITSQKSTKNLVTIFIEELK